MTQPATKDTLWLSGWLAIFVALAVITWMAAIGEYVIAAPPALVRRLLDHVVNGRNLSFEERAWTEELPRINEEVSHG